MKILNFDTEIKLCIQGKDEEKDPVYEYCEGWKDHVSMGISVLVAYASWLKKYIYFDENNLPAFIRLIAEADLVIGFNIFGFDIALLKATLVRLGLPEKTGMAGKCYDILGNIRKETPTKGWSLDNIMQATFGVGKSGKGAEAPRLWQDGKIAELYNYGTNDVMLSNMLWEHVYKGLPIMNDKGDSVILDGFMKWSENQSA